MQIFRTKNPWVFHRSFPLLMQHVLHFSIVLAPLHQESLVLQDFPSSDATFPTFCSMIWLFCTKILGSSQDFPRFLRFSTFVGPTAPRILGSFTGFFHMFGLTAPKNCWVFTGFSSSDAFTGFSSSDAKFPHAHTTYHHGASRICKNFQIF